LPIVITAVQEKRAPYSSKEHRLPSKWDNTSAVQQSQSAPKNVEGIPFPFHTVSYTPTHMVNNFDVKSEMKSAASTMLQILTKAEKAEGSVVVQLVPSLANRMLPKDTRRSLLTVITWAKEIPMFTQLSIEDQIELIKVTWNEINTLKLVYHVATSPGREEVNFQMDDVPHLYLTESQTVIEQAIKECVSSVGNVCLDKTELSYLKLITLMNPCK